MEKLINRYLAGEASQKEVEELIEWAGKSEENMARIAKIKILRTNVLMPERRAGADEADSFVRELRRRSKTKRKLQINRWVYASVAAASIILFVYIFKIIDDRERLESEISFILSQEQSIYENSTPLGVKGKIVLPDSTIVWMNSGSTIRYPSKFRGNTREITFTGEGYFEVKKNPERPMSIQLDNGLKVSVTGTKFNLTSYLNDNTISLLLVEGSVSLYDSRKMHLYELKPDQKISYSKVDSKISIVNPEDQQPITGWKNGWLIFEDTPMVEIIKKLERWYGVKIIVMDSSVLKKNLTAKFREESLSQVLELMHRISLINYTLKDSTVFISPF